jgi:hypothetical protein
MAIFRVNKLNKLIYKGGFTCDSHPMTWEAPQDGPYAEDLVDAEVAWQSRWPRTRGFFWHLLG